MNCCFQDTSLTFGFFFQPEFHLFGRPGEKSKLFCMFFFCLLQESISFFNSFYRPNLWVPICFGSRFGMRPGPRVISSRKSESALVGIHGRAELSGTEVSESNSAPPILTEDVPFRIFPHLEGNLDGSAPRSCSNVSSSDTFHETFLESLSGKHLRDVGECNPFALSRAIRRNWRQRTIWSMLSRIDEIPLQVEGMLTKTASDLSMQVDGGVVQMQDHLRISSGGQQVAENLENLPRHFATSVEANLMDAAALLRETVLQVTAELSARDFEAEDIVQEIQVIPQRVRKVADEAISRAVKTSVEELHQQLDEALGVLGSSTCEKELLQHLDQLPVVMQKRIVATGAVVDLAEDQIVDLAADLKSEFVPNHELMEALLRAKTAHEIGVVTLRYETDMEHEKVDTAQRLEKLKQTDESKFQNPGSSLASNFLGFL